MNLNYNPYNVNPFEASDVQILSNAPNLDKHLSQSILGLELMDTRNIRSRVKTEMSDSVEGVTGRWTYFTKL